MKLRFSRLTGSAFFLATIFLGSCQKSLHQPEESYIFVANNINLPYFQEAQAGLLDAARGLGVKADFVGPALYNPNGQLDALEKAVSRKPAGILISPARAEMFKATIDSAVAQGIPVICVDSDAPGSKRLLFIGTDNYQAGLHSGRLVAELIKGEGKLAIITVPGQFNLEERMRGVKEVLKNYPKIQVVETINDKGDPRLANDTISAMIEAKKPLDVILCLEASGGVGAAEAVRRLERVGKIQIVAMDKDPETLDWISNGVIAATVVQKPYTMAFYGLKMLDDLHHNVVRQFKDWQTAPLSPLPAKIDTGTGIVDKNNVEAFKAAAPPRAPKM